MMTPSLTKLMQKFDLAGFEIRIVGGAVRDKLLGIEPKDIDLCTDATPDEMQDIAKINGFSFIPTGIAHGTATIVVDGDVFEVTTLRVDVDTDGRHAEVEFTRDFEADAARRDLTINAMSMDAKGNIYDYFGGRDDLANCRMRFVGDADARVKEDYLRILRFFRFMARFGGMDESLDQVSAICTPENLVGLQKISVERYWLEMQKLVVMPGAVEVLDCMYYNGVLKAIGLARPDMVIDPQNMAPVTALSTMVRDVDAFLDQWKLSSEEANMLRFLKGPRTVYFEEDVEDLLMDNVSRDWVVAKAQLDWVLASGDMAAYAKTWEAPKFPVTGQDLLDRGFKQGVELGLALKDMREQWKQSVFRQSEVSREDLLKGVVA